MAQRLIPVDLHDGPIPVGLDDIDDEAVAATETTLEYTNTGRETLYIVNGSGAGRTATPTGQVDRSGMMHAVTADAASIAAGKIGVIGPLNPSGYGTLVSVVLNSVTDVKVLLVRDRPPLR